MPIANTLQLFINIEASKISSTQNQNEKLNIKMELLGKIIAKISNEARIKTPKSFKISS